MKGQRAIIRKDAPKEEPRFRGLSGTVGSKMADYVWFRLDAAVDGYFTILVHPESLQEITDGTS